MSCSKQLHALGVFSGELDRTSVKLLKPVPPTTECSVCGLVDETAGFFSCRQFICKTCYPKCALDSLHACQLDQDDCMNGVVRKNILRENITARAVTGCNEASGDKILPAEEMLCHHPRYTEHCTDCPERSATIIRSGLGRHLKQSRESSFESSASHLPVSESSTGRKKSLLLHHHDFFKAEPNTPYEVHFSLGHTGTLVEVYQIANVLANNVEDQNPGTTMMASLKPVLSRHLSGTTTHPNNSSTCTKELIDAVISGNQDLLKEIRSTKNKVINFLHADTEFNISDKRSPPEAAFMQAVGESLTKMCGTAEQLFAVTSQLRIDGNSGCGRTGDLSPMYFDKFQANSAETHATSLHQFHNATWMKGPMTAPVDPLEGGINAFVRYIEKGKKTFQWVVDRYLDSKIRTWAGGEYTCWGQSVHIAGHYLTPGATFSKGTMSGGRLVLRFIFKLQRQLTDKTLHWPFQQIKQVIIHPDRPFEEKLKQKIYCDVLGTPESKRPMYLQLASYDSFCTTDLERDGYIKNDSVLLRFEVFSV